MKLVVGLGNPGKKYENTRHNIGFLIVEELVRENREKGTDFEELANFGAKVATIYTASGDTVRVVEPLTYMNASGEAVAELKNYFKVSGKDILIIHDDVDLPLGKIRVSKGSGAAGHHGVESVLEKIDKSELTRVRVGIEARTEPNKIPTEAYVLQNFTPQESYVVGTEIIPLALAEIKKILDEKK